MALFTRHSQFWTAALLFLCSSSSIVTADTTPLSTSEQLPELIDTQSESEKLYQQINEHGSLIRIHLLQIKDAESAAKAIHSLRQHHKVIVKNFGQLHEIIRKEGYHMSDIKKQMSTNTRLFGTIGILAHDILENDAYGSEELAVLLTEFCPDNYDVATTEHNRAELLLQSQGLSTPSSFVKAEQMLYQLHAVLVNVHTAEAAKVNANIINELVVGMLEADAQIKYILSQADEQEFTFIINKLHLIRHLGSLCRIEIERMRAADFYQNESLIATFKLEKAHLEKLRLASSTNAAAPDGSRAKK